MSDRLDKFLIDNVSYQLQSVCLCVCVYHVALTQHPVWHWPPIDVGLMSDYRTFSEWITLIHVICDQQCLHHLRPWRIYQHCQQIWTCGHSKCLIDDSRQLTVINEGLIYQTLYIHHNQISVILVRSGMNEITIITFLIIIIAIATATGSISSVRSGTVLTRRKFSKKKTGFVCFKDFQLESRVIYIQLYITTWRHVWPL